MSSTRYCTVDWKRLASTDLDKVRDHPNHPAIQENLENILNCNIHKEFDLSCVDSNLVKLFELAQLATRNQIDCQEYLSGVIVALGDKLKSAEISFRQNELKLEKSTKECEKLKKECLMRKSLLASQQQMIVSGYGGPSACPFCEKTFIAPNYLLVHVQKRHPEQKTSDSLYRPDPRHRDQVELSINNEIASLKKQLSDYEEKTEQIRKQEREAKLAHSDQNLQQIREMIGNFERDICEKMTEQTDKTAICKELDSLRRDLTTSINQIKGNQKNLEQDVRELKTPKETVRVVDNRELIEKIEGRHLDQIHLLKTECSESLEAQKHKFKGKTQALVAEHEEALSQSQMKIKQLRAKIRDLEGKLAEASKVRHVTESVERVVETPLARRNYKTFNQHRQICQDRLAGILSDNGISKSLHGIGDWASIADKHFELTKKRFKNMAKYLELRKAGVVSLNERLRLQNTVLNHSPTAHLREQIKNNFVTKTGLESQKRSDFRPVVSELVDRQNAMKSQKSVDNADYGPISELLEGELRKDVAPSQPTTHPIAQHSTPPRLDKSNEDDDTSQWSDIEELY